MNPKKRATFPSRGGIMNARRRPIDALTLSARARAFQRRERAAREMGFFEGEARDFIHAIPLKGKHLREPMHVRDVISPFRVANTKKGFEFDSLSTHWSARIRRFQRTLPERGVLRRTSVERATFVLADTIRFFGNEYGKATALQLALDYLSGADIQKPRVPKEIAVERTRLRPFFEQFQSFVESRSRQVHEVKRLQGGAKMLGYRVVKKS